MTTFANGKGVYRMKKTNPKDFVGCDKIPFHLWPETATLL